MPNQTPDLDDLSLDELQQQKTAILNDNKRLLDEKEGFEENIKTLEEKNKKLDKFINLKFKFGELNLEHNFNSELGWKFKWLCLLLSPFLAFMVISVFLIWNDNQQAIYKPIASQNDPILFQYVDDQGNGVPNYKKMSPNDKYRLLGIFFRDSLKTTDEIPNIVNNSSEPRAGTCQGLFYMTKNKSGEEEINPRGKKYNSYIKGIRDNKSISNKAFTKGISDLMGIQSVDEFKIKMEEAKSNEWTLTEDNKTEIPKCEKFTRLLLALKMKYFSNALNGSDDIKNNLIKKIQVVYKHINQNDPDLLSYIGVSQNLRKETQLMDSILGNGVNVSLRFYNQELDHSSDMCELYLDKGVFSSDTKKEVCTGNFEGMNIVSSVSAQGTEALFNQLTDADKLACFQSKKCEQDTSVLSDSGRNYIIAVVAFFLFMAIIFCWLVYTKLLQEKVRQYDDYQKKLKADHKGIENINKSLKENDEKLKNIETSLNKKTDSRVSELTKIKQGIEQLLADEEIELVDITNRINAVK